MVLRLPKATLEDVMPDVEWLEILLSGHYPLACFFRFAAQYFFIRADAALSLAI
jgi:hypothetical protein